MTAFIRLLSFLGVTLAAFGAQAQAKFVEGKDYQKLSIEVPLHKKGQAEVVEYFWYGCPHCYHINPAVKTWEKKNKPKNAAFHHVPATSGNWEFAAKGMYIADKLKLDKAKFHDAYFAEIHTKKNRGVAFNDDAFAKFLKDGFKVEKADYDKAKKSLQVKSKLKAAQNRNLLVDVTSVPVFVVNGKYLVSAQMAGTENRMFEIINSLLAKDQASEPKATAKKPELKKSEQKKPEQKKEVKPMDKKVDNKPVEQKTTATPAG